MRRKNSDFYLFALVYYTDLGQLSSFDTFSGDRQTAAYVWNIEILAVFPQRNVVA